MTMQQDVAAEITRLAAETAVRAAMDYLKQEEKHQQKAKKDWRRRNTKLLLKNYRLFVTHCEGTTLSMSEFAETLEDLDREEFAVESIMKSKKRTAAMVNFMQRMMDTYQIMCERSERDEDMRRYKVIKAMYLSDELLSAEEVADIYGVEPRTVYLDINNACKVLSVLMFGVDGLRFD